MKTIEVTVSPTGDTKVETKGCVGGECQAISRDIEEALGARTHEAFTAEYHLAAPQSPVVAQRSGSDE